MMRTAEMDALRDQILDQTLPNIPFDGWNMKSLSLGAELAGLEAADASIAFPGGVAQAIDYWMERTDERMFEAMVEANYADMKVRERIAFAVRTRLELVAPHKEAVRRALSHLALPGHQRLAAKSLYRTCDAIWRAAGDTSTDFNFYTKRGLLAGVYSSTLLFWLADESDDHEESWEFLERRISNVLKIPKLTGKLKKVTKRLPSPLKLLNLAKRFRASEAAG